MTLSERLTSLVIGFTTVEGGLCTGLLMSGGHSTGSRRAQHRGPSAGRHPHGHAFPGSLACSSGPSSPLFHAGLPGPPTGLAGTGHREHGLHRDPRVSGIRPPPSAPGRRDAARRLLHRQDPREEGGRQGQGVWAGPARAVGSRWAGPPWLHGVTGASQRLCPGPRPPGHRAGWGQGPGDSAWWQGRAAGTGGLGTLPGALGASAKTQLLPKASGPCRPAERGPS